MKEWKDEWINEWTCTPDSLVVKITRSAALSSLGFPTRSSASPVVPPIIHNTHSINHSIGVLGTS